MKTLIFSTVLVVTLLTCAPVFGAQVSIGIRIGPPPAPRHLAVVPVSPGPDYVWVAGYWYPVGNHYKWHEGYWTRAPYARAHWVGPRYEGGQFFQGYWDGDRGRTEHDHKWDTDHDRRDHDRRDHDRRDHDRD